MSREDQDSREGAIDAGEASDAGPSGEKKAGKQQNRSILQDAIHLMSGRISHVVVRILIGIAAARIWGPEARGMIATAMIISVMAYTIVDLGMAKSIPYMVGRKTAPLKQIIGSAMSMWIVASVFAVGAMLAYFSLPGSRGVGTSDEVPWAWILLSAAQIPARLLAAYARGFAVGYRKLKFIAHLYWITDPAILFIILIAGGLLGYNSTEDGWIYLAAYTLTFSCVAVLSFRLIGSEVGLSFKGDRTTWKGMISRSVVYGMSTVMMVLNYKLSVILLARPALGVTKEDLGNFIVGVGIAELLWQLPRTMGQILYSRSVNTEDEMHAANQTAHTSRLSMAVAVPIGVAFALAAPWLVPLVYGPEYPKTATITQLLIPGVIVFFAARTFEADFLGKGKPWTVIGVMAPAVLLNAVLVAIFVPRYGMNAAAIISSATYTAGALAMAIAYSRFTGLPIRDLLIMKRGDLEFLMRRLRRLKQRTVIKQSKADTPPGEGPG